MNFTKDELEKLKPSEVLESLEVKERFKALFLNVNVNNFAKLTPAEKENIAESHYESEKQYFLKAIEAKPDLLACTGTSIFGCFLDLATNGLTLENTGKPLMYLEIRSFESPKGSGKWIKHARIIYSPYGELALRINAGQISYIDNPVIVFEGDDFQPFVKDGIKSINYTPKIPRKSTKIIASFVIITRPDGSKDFLLDA